MSTLKIVKQSNKVWQHIDSILGSLIVSKFFFVTENNKFQLVSKGKTLYNSYDIPSEVQIVDETDGGFIETYSSALTLSLRLEQLGYPAFLFEGQISTISGLIEAGANVEITGLGTAESPYIISSSGGGSFTPSDYDLNEFTNESADPFVRVSEVPSTGVVSKVVYCTLEDVGATDPNQPDIDDLVKAWVVSQNITKLPNEEYIFVLEGNFSGGQPSYIENYVHNYIHTQTISSNIWNINHNLNRIPNVVVTDFSNNDYEGDINYIDNNNLTITFSTPLNGKATLT